MAGNFWAKWGNAGEVDPTFTGYAIDFRFLVMTDDDEYPELSESFCVADPSADDEGDWDAISAAHEVARRALATKKGSDLIEEAADEWEVDPSDFCQYEFCATVWVDGRRGDDFEDSGPYNW